MLLVPSISVLAAGGPAPHRQWRMLALADPVYEITDDRLSVAPGANPVSSVIDDAQVLRSGRGLGLQRLRGSRREVEKIEQLGTGRVDTLTGTEATVARLQGRDLSVYTHLHFATHAVVNPSDPSASGVILSLYDAQGNTQVGLLNSRLVSQLKLDADLVVLSGCETALGRNVKGEGLMGLSRAFYQAGARGVIASLWQVSDRATADLMSAFYQHQIKNQQPAYAALRQASLELMAKSRFKHPFYWAAFAYRGGP